MRRSLKDKQKLYTAINIFLQIIDIIDVTAKDVQLTFHPKVIDFEDELICVCAERAKVDSIITRNIKDFIHSPVSAITPKDFLTKFYEHL